MSNWATEKVINIIRHLKEVEGLSAGQIAAQLNKTRNQICGVINRNNIGSKFKPVNQYAKKDGVVKEKRIRFKPNKAQIMIAENYVPPVEQRKTLLELKNNSCRWPLGDGPDYFFCGGDAGGNLPYCEHHCAIAYNAKREPFDPTRKRDRNSI